MFIGIAGPICSGKRSVANYLVANHGFVRLRLRPIPDANPSPSDRCDLHELSNALEHSSVSGDIYFPTIAEMTDYVTKRWRENFVTVDIWTEDDLEIVAKRPFFILVTVDAPVTIRYKRFTER
jgi:dCMP deaminase